MVTNRIDNTTRQKLEQLFEMSGGYVLDFSNASFATFVQSCHSIHTLARIGTGVNCPGIRGGSGVPGGRHVPSTAWLRAVARSSCDQCGG